MSEESKLVDDVVESAAETTTETKEGGDKFNPLAFAGDDAYEAKEEEKEEKEDVNPLANEDVKTDETDEDGWAWDSKAEKEEEKRRRV